MTLIFRRMLMLDTVFSPRFASLLPIRTIEERPIPNCIPITEHKERLENKSHTHTCTHVDRKVTHTTQNKHITDKHLNMGVLTIKRMRSGIKKFLTFSFVLPLSIWLDNSLDVSVSVCLSISVCLSVCLSSILMLWLLQTRLLLRFSRSLLISSNEHTCCHLVILLS